MSQAIALDAEFQSYAAFQTALDEYCRQNSIANVPLAFVRQASKKLAANTFTDEMPLDREIIERFVYKGLALVCVYHRTNCSKKDGLFCEGRITLRFVREQNVLRISSFFGHHSNHHSSMGNLPTENSLVSLRNDRLNRIFALIRQMPDDGALNLVEESCESILEKWHGGNNGLEIYIVEKDASLQLSGDGDTYDAEMPPIKSEMLSQELNVSNIDGNIDDQHDHAPQGGNSDGMFGQYSLAANEQQYALNGMTVKSESTFRYSDRSQQ